MVEKKHIYTVSEITRGIKNTLENQFASVWVEGEISNFVHHSSGHMYFSLKDQASVLQAALFKNINQGLKFQLGAGIQVVCFGKIDVYPPRGQYQIIITKIEPKGLGALQLAFEQLKKKLEQEGLFDPKHKRPIPFLPKRIGIVTSPTGAAIQDILQVLNRRFANLEVVLNPVRVQGELAAGEIARAIDQFNQYGKVDVLIVGRGGGSLEDLWPFNEEIVARAIYNSKIPVISAVGHEIDFTIADFVADLRAPTPSAAAEQVITHKQELLNKINNLFERARLAVNNSLELLENRLENLQARYAFRRPTDLIEQYQQRIDDLVSTLTLKTGHLLEMSGERYKLLVGKLSVLSPLNILSRGYSMTLILPQEKVISSAAEVQPGSKLKTRFAQSAIISKVEEIIKNG